VQKEKNDKLRRKYEEHLMNFEGTYLRDGWAESSEI